VGVVTLAFTVKADAAFATFSSAFSFTVEQMVNPYSLAFATGLAGRVLDSRGGTRTVGQIVCADIPVVGANLVRL
jgi:hypothetical protein